MGKSKVKVCRTEPTEWYDVVDDNIEDLFEKFGDILIDWKIVTNEDGELIIWYVLKDDDDTPDVKQIKI